MGAFNSIPYVRASKRDCLISRIPLPYILIPSPCPYILRTSLTLDLYYLESVLRNRTYLAKIPFKSSNLISVEYLSKTIDYASQPNLEKLLKERKRS